MRILVCVKQVPDTMEVKLSSNLTLQRDFVAQVMNPADESALELALRLRDQNGGAVTVLTMGPERAESMLREMLSRGADKAAHLIDPAFAGSDTLMTARFLSMAARHLGGYDLILCGKRAADGETGQVGPMLAQMLNMACVPNITGAELQGSALTAHQLTETGTIIWRARVPCVLTLCEWSCRLRLPTIMGLRRARNAQILKLTSETIGNTENGFKASPTRVIHVRARPTGMRPCQKLAMGEALAALSEKGVLP